MSRGLRAYPYWESVQETIEGLSLQWPLLAGAIDRVRVSSRLKAPTYAEARVQNLVTVSGTLDLAKWALQDPQTPNALLGFYATGWMVGGTLSDVVIHEWGHLLVLVAVCRAYPHDLGRGLDRFVTCVEEEAGMSRELAAPALSLTAQVNLRELTAEAFVDGNLSNPHPFSTAMVRLLRELWQT